MEIEEILDKYQGTTKTIKNDVHLRYYDAATNIVREMCSEYAGGKHGDYVIVSGDHWMILLKLFNSAPDEEKSMIFHVLVSRFDKVLKLATKFMNRKYGERKWSPQNLIE